MYIYPGKWLDVFNASHISFHMFSMDDYAEHLRVYFGLGIKYKDTLEVLCHYKWNCHEYVISKETVEVSWSFSA